MTLILTIIHIVVCLFLIAIVLLQHGKGADMGAAFGGGASQTVFGTEGPLPLLNKITTMAAVIFMLTSLALAFFSSNIGKDSVMRAVAPPPVPAENALERAPSTIPLPDTTTTGPTESASQQFPGTVEQQPAATEEPAPATFPGEPAPPAAEPQQEQPTPAAKPEAQGESKQ